MLTFNRTYFTYAVVLFLIELMIALFVFDKIVRPYVGDFLVVILIYCFMMAFWKIPVLKAALSVLLFSYFVEFLQYLKIVNILGWQDSKLATIIIGTHFAWGDIFAYTLGIIFVLLLENWNLFGNGKLRIK